MSDNNNTNAKPPLLPSLLYTEGSEKVNKEVEDELKVPDPEDAGAAIAANVVEESDEATSSGKQ